jgi:hypothetical protein
VKLKDGKDEVCNQLEMKSMQNDGWLNTYMDPILTLWCANFDLQLTIGVGKITNYMTKYMTKSEAKQTKSAQAMICCIMHQALDEGKLTEYILQKMMAKLHREPMISKQAVHHLIMWSQPMVDCSHSFSEVNLENNSHRLLVEPDETEGNDDSETTPATKMTLMDAYACRMDATNWESEDAFHMAVENGLEEMSLFWFCSKHYVGVCGGHRNKIKPHIRKEVVTFYPSPNSNPGSKDYPKYCKYLLMIHKPSWVNDTTTLWGNIKGEPSDENLVQLWKQFCEDLKKSGEQIPNFLCQDIDQVKAFVSEHTEQEELLGGSEEVGEDDDGAELKEWADDNFRLENDVENPDDNDIEWSLDHNFVDGHVCEYQRPSTINVPRSDKRSIFMNMQTVSTEMVAVPHSDAKLNFLQECAHDVQAGSSRHVFKVYAFDRKGRNRENHHNKHGDPNFGTMPPCWLFAQTCHHRKGC